MSDLEQRLRMIIGARRYDNQSLDTYERDAIWDAADTLAGIRPYLNHLVNCKALLPSFDTNHTVRYGEVWDVFPCSCGLIDVVNILDRSNPDE